MLFLPCVSTTCSSTRNLLALPCLLLWGFAVSAVAFVKIMYRIKKNYAILGNISLPQFSLVFSSSPPTKEIPLLDPFFTGEEFVGKVSF